MRLIGQGVVRLDQVRDAPIKIADLPGEHLDHGFDAGCDLFLPGAVAVQLLGLSHVDQLPAPPEKIGEPGVGLAERDGGRKVEGGAHLRQARASTRSVLAKTPVVLANSRA
ncbi:hypothetical protein NS365_15835 [Aureimonas ureilytica]|uniref:Uncharacterized protein n=1 Tax=Aureimonas ureilytica TaxID=401562 RepID=A0A175RKR1_9HYPH|nr:hypothetical protein NS365_15835 [Aureimonas ureilytica]